MSSLINFHFEDQEVRYVGDGVNHEWIAQDVCNVLGIKSARYALREFSQYQRGMVTMHTLGGMQKMLTVTESGLYRLLFKSRKPIAERFQNWVTDEVLPSIQKTGSYSLGGEDERLERQFRHQLTAKDRADALKILKIGGHSKQYILRISLEMAKKLDPSIDPPVAAEMIGLPIAKALITRPRTKNDRPIKTGDLIRVWLERHPNIWYEAVELTDLVEIGSLSINTVYKALIRLADKGYISKEKRTRQTKTGSRDYSVFGKFNNNSAISQEI